MWTVIRRRVRCTLFRARFKYGRQDGRRPLSRRAFTILRGAHLARSTVSAYRYKVKFPRCSGVLLHITSLPGRFGIGDLGPSAYEFADFLSSAGQKLWQVLPLNPTGYADSPYQCFSAFAGNHLLVSFERLRDEGILEAADLATTQFPDDSVDYGRVIEFKLRVLKRAAQVFLAAASRPDRAAFESF